LESKFYNEWLHKVGSHIKQLIVGKFFLHVELLEGCKYSLFSVLLKDDGTTGQHGHGQ